LPTKRPPGRPTPEDGRLEVRRNEYVHLLSVSWADIVWQIRRASTREEFRKALEPLTGRDQDQLISPFVMPSTLPTTGKKVRAARRAHGKANEHIYDANQRHEQILGLYSQIKLAMLEADADQRQVLQTDLTKYETELRLAEGELEAARTRAKTLQDELKAQEASFAQEELAKIILENRCARNPRRLADAMAGLPFLSARVSYGRCSKFKIVSWPHFQLRVVGFIESTWNRRHRYPALSTVELFHQEIKRLPRTVKREKLPEPIEQSIQWKRVENNLRSHLGKNWRYLRLAIEKTLSSPDIDQTRIPFLIASNFITILGEPRTQLTLALAERERIDN
jgi:hypothetical protein